MFKRFNAMKKILLFFVTINAFVISGVLSQPLCNFQHYSGEDGLSENIVMCMLQDQKGFMWFGTWDGLNKFDGYRFKTYKSRPGDYNGLVSNRITDIKEDAYGFIWILTYDGSVHRFNPRTEQFLRAPQFYPEFSSFKSQITKITILNKKEIWLLTQESGCFKATTDSISNELSITYYSKENGKLPSNSVNSIHIDKEKNHWLLTSNGLVCLPINEQKSTVLLAEPNEARQNFTRPFFSVLENNTELLFGSNEGKIWRYNKKDASLTLLQLPLESNIVSIKSISANRILIASSASGFCILDENTGDIQTFNQYNTPQLHCQGFVSTYIDRSGEVWMEPNCDGVAHFNPKTNDVSFFRMKTDNTSPYLLLPNFFIFEDINNVLWVHPRGGGFSYYNRNKKELSFFYNEPGSSSRRFSNLMHSAYSDFQGNLWMCTYSAELEKVSFIEQNFKKIKPQPESDAFSVNEVRAIFEDDENYLWVATKDGTLHIFDANRKKIGILTQSGKIAPSGNKFDGMVYAIMQDKNKNIWLGSKGLGLFKLSKKKNGDHFECTFQNFRFNHDNIYSLSNDNVYSVYEDASGRIWIATYGGGINLLIEKNGEQIFYNGRNYFKNYPVNDYQRARFITTDKYGNAWVGTTDGLLVFNSTISNLEDVQFYHYKRIPGDKNSLGGNDVHYIICSKDNVYIAVFGGGLNVLSYPFKAGDEPRFNTLTTKDGLSTDVIISLVEDNDGNIWMNTENDISKYDPETRTFENFSATNGFISHYFSEASTIKSHTGELMFGADNGFYLFSPNEMKKSNHIPPIVFSRFQLFGKDVVVGAEDSPLKVDISEASEITLNHKQIVFNIEFAALDFRGPENIDYAYKLEGFDDNWNYSQKQRNVTYTNLPHGTYVFHVRSTNSEGVWVSNDRSIIITILPSFWETPWAILIYIIAGILLFSIIIYILFTIYQLKNKVSIEQKITNMKLRFFTDISHELRTPLTLIAAPVEYILEKESINENVRTHLVTVQKNTSRMLRLINQILDFRKIQNKKMKMHVEEFPLGPFVSTVCENFVQVADEHKIDFSIIDQTDGATIWADKDKVEKIIFNILSNAFKFTPQGKSIQVLLTRTEKEISIEIKDQGKGISKEKLKTLFERFVSSDNKLDSFQPGTGIGLSLSKELIDMHNASIHVESEVGVGTTFTVGFLTGTKHFDPKTVDFIIQDGQSIENKDISDSNEIKSDKTKDIAITENNKKDDNTIEDIDVDDNLLLPTLLIIEDNEEVRSFLRLILNKKYHILEAGDGKTGLEIAQREIPDFVISDIMMPGMSGLEVTEQLKSGIETSHIPIILLTAKSDIDSKLEGLKYGADDYITKPFSASHLEIRIENILQQRIKWRETFINQISDISEESGHYEVTPSLPQISPYDHDFMERIMQIMEENMDNIDLKVDDLVSEMRMSRTVFFKKLKSITGLAPIEFIKEVRIKRAAQLIESGEYTIAQITYMVGMNDPRYFSRCFKQKYEMTPSEYKDKYTKKKDNAE